MRLVWVMLLVLALPATAVAAPAGSVDHSFGRRGVVHVGPSSVVPDGRGGTVAVGPGIRIVRRTPSGHVDPRVHTRRLAPGMHVSDVAVGPDGTVAVLASQFVNDAQAVYRVRPDGALDTGFGSDGHVTVTNLDTGVAVLADGTIAVNVEDGILELERGGAPLQRFGAGGKALLPLTFGDIRGLQPASAGRLLVTFSLDEDPHVEPAHTVLRLLPDGAIDPSFRRFDADGILTPAGLIAPIDTPCASLEDYCGVDVRRADPNGRLRPNLRTRAEAPGVSVGAGPDRRIYSTADSAVLHDGELVRQTPDGAIDRHFGHAGRVALPPSASPGFIEVQPRRVVVAVGLGGTNDLVAYRTRATSANDRARARRDPPRLR